MLDVASLERQWLKYKIKQLLPYLFALLGSIALIVTFISFSDTNTSSSPPLKERVPTTLKKEPETTFKDETMDLEPSMQFIQSITPNVSENPPTTSIPVVVEKKTPPPHDPIASPTPVVKVPQPLKIPLSTPTAIHSNDTTTRTSIKRDSNTFDIHEIEDRFRNNSNPHLGLYIAHYHYDNGNYNEAYNYALKTNAINNTLEESWLIFAKSLVKLGKADQAKKTLQLYISQSNSEEAKNLLNTLNKEGGK